jgi:HPt (histidine-containing phosphotransfer) domain-containing protein
VNLAPELADLVPCYLANRRNDMETLAAALGRGDFELMSRLGHNMHGSGTSFGLDGLSAIGVAIERAANAGDRVEIARAVAAHDGVPVAARAQRQSHGPAAACAVRGDAFAAGAAADDRAVDVLLSTTRR